MSINLEYSEFTGQPQVTVFRPTGSFDYRDGLYNRRPMTLKEQRFEKFVNDEQAKHDKESQIQEWQRRKAVEERAISIWYGVKENLEDFIVKMRTLDQQEAEYRIQRKNDKAKNLDPQKSLDALREMEMERQRRDRVQKAQEREREQQRVDDLTRATFEARVQASSPCSGPFETYH